MVWLRLTRISLLRIILFLGNKVLVIVPEFCELTSVGRIEKFIFGNNDARLMPTFSCVDNVCEIVCWYCGSYRYACLKTSIMSDAANVYCVRQRYNSNENIDFIFSLFRINQAYSGNIYN